MIEAGKKSDKIQQAMMKLKACGHNEEKGVITHLLVLLLFASVFVFVIKILVPLTAPPMRYNNDLLGDKHLKNW